MKKTRLIAMLCAIAMSLTLVLPVSAANVDYFLNLPRGTVYASTDHIPPETQAVLDRLETMTLEELNSFINAQAAKVQDGSMQNRVDPIEAVRLAWLAAALIAERAGYPLAATLVRASVNGNDYQEINGDFSVAIKASAEYKNWLRDTSVDSIAFLKSRNADLFFSLHKVNIRIGSGGSQGAKIVVDDIFDFAFITKMENIFVEAINNWAWLCQQTGVLHPIDVAIVFDV